MVKYRTLYKLLAGIHYLLIGAYSGSISQLIESMANYFAYKFSYKKHIRNLLVALFTISFIIFGILIYTDIYDILPIIVSLVSTIIIFTKDTNDIRTSQFILIPLLLIYNIVNISYGGIITNIIILISCIYGKNKLDGKKGS